MSFAEYFAVKHRAEKVCLAKNIRKAQDKVVYLTRNLILTESKTERKVRNNRKFDCIENTP